MRFESRDLKSHAEPVSASELKEGGVYFSVNFLDQDMLVPLMEPVVFIGRNLNPEDAGQLYFQDAGSYWQGLRYESAATAEDAAFYRQSETEIKHIFEYDHALDRLMACSLRRRKAGGAA